MLFDLTLKLLKEIMVKAEVHHVELSWALNPVYIEYDDETLEEKEDQEYPDEYDIIIFDTLSHSQIQAIDEALTEYSRVEMRLRDGKLEIFETEREEEA